VHVVHLVYGFAAGGLENVVVQLIDGLPHEAYRHTVVALTAVDPVFASRIQRTDVELISLNKKPGQPFGLYPRMYKLLRALKPDVLHSCNLAALEFAPVAMVAGVPCRVHAEHGWDVADPDGSNRKFRWYRRVYGRFVQRFVAVSQPIYDYLVHAVGMAPGKVRLVINGVDTVRFRPARAGDPVPPGFPFTRGEHWVVGSVGRLETIKNHRLLVEAFAELVQSNPSARERVRLMLVGSGALEAELRQLLADRGCADLAWLAGSRADVPDLLRHMDCFVMPSLAEGTSCTLQEAMVTGLPIIATDVGGNGAVLGAGTLGALVPSGDVRAMVQAISRCWADPAVARVDAAAAGTVGRELYGLAPVLAAYNGLFRLKAAL
jgi:sugar transferase (PEP-CTERM/EpsH1 system associated)